MKTKVGKLSVQVLLGLCTCTFSGQSAKTIFNDPSSGVNTMAGSPATQPAGAPPGPNVPAASHASPGHAARRQPVGLNYWLEMMSPRGELVRVSTARQFHTGDRIRLHLRSNVDGYLTIVTRQSGEPAELLFPGNQKMNNAVARLQEEVFPSPTAWFRFDDRPGELTLTLSLQRAVLGDVAPPVQTAQQVVARTDQSTGERGLKIQEDTSPSSGSVYAVNVNQPLNGPGEISLQVRLHHVR